MLIEAFKNYGKNRAANTKRRTMYTKVHVAFLRQTHQVEEMLLFGVIQFKMKVQFLKTQRPSNTRLIEI